ncbi:MAG: TlpA disulfide reductase family protein [Balneolaceae bacterium]
MKLHFGLFLIVILILCGCSSEQPSENKTVLQGVITVDENLESSGNYSGIELLVSINDSSGERSDTLFYAVTDSTGHFSGTALVPHADIYPLFISRNRNTFGIFNIVLADDDTVTINGELPNMNETTEIESKENNVFKTFERVDRNFNRVAQYINAGAIPEDSISIEIEKWSDIYWDVYDEHSDTFASKLSAEASIALLSGWNDSLMVARKDEYLSNSKTLRRNTREVLTEYYAGMNGLDGALQFLDELEQIAPSGDQKMGIRMDRIELLYDSSRTRQANELLENFREEYESNSQAMEWAESIGYDLEVLSPGSPFPPLTFATLDGDTISTEDLSGRPFLIEITRLDNRLYHEQYDRTVAIYQIYRNFGLEIITIPVNANNVMIQAFYDERGLIWDVAQPNSIDVQELVEILNVNQVPTRFLVNNEGKIIRRYIGNEYDEIVQGLQQIITQNQTVQ